MRDDHLEQFHLQKQSLMPGMIKEADKDVLEQLGYELVKSDDVAGINAFATTSMPTDLRYMKRLLECAAQHASPGMIRALVAIGKETVTYVFGKLIATKSEYKAFMLNTIAGNNLDTLQQLLELEHEQWGMWAGFHKSHMREGCLRVLDLLSDEMFDRMYTCFEQDTLSIKSLYMPSALMVSSFRQEQILLGLWKQVPKHAWVEGGWRKALGSVAATTCSIELVRYLLAQGIPIDTRRGNTSLTALHQAVRKNTRESAELARFLLKNGADPEITQEIKIHDQSKSLEKSGRKTILETRRIRDEKGAKEISKWLGITWDELLEETEDARQKPAEPELISDNPDDSSE